MVVPPALFTYQVTPTAVPVSSSGSAGESSVTLMFFVSNLTGRDVDADEIAFEVPVGGEERDLTADPQLRPQSPGVAPWVARCDGDGVVRLASDGGEGFPGLRAGESIGVAVPGIVVNQRTGLVTIPVWERSDGVRQSYVSVVKTDPGLAITKFQAAPVQVLPGGEGSMLSWSTTGAAEVTLTYGGEVHRVDRDASTQVTPRHSTLYTLTATGEGRAVHQQLTVYVPQVAVLSFGASPALIPTGGSSVLSWALVNASSAMILASGSEPDPGPVDPREGRLEVRPRDVSTTYTLIADGFGNTVSAPALVELRPLIERFNVLPAQFARGSALPVTLGWKALNATGVTITPDLGAVPSEGERPLPTDRATLTYRLDAKRLPAPVTATSRAVGAITRFAVWPQGWGTGAKWSIAGADECFLEVNRTRHRVAETGDYGLPEEGAYLVLYGVEKATNWASSITAVAPFYNSGGIEATCPYGLAAEGAQLTIAWTAVRPATQLSVRTGGVTHTQTISESGRTTLTIGAPQDGSMWQLWYHKMHWNVSYGAPWTGAAVQDGPQAG